MPVEEGAAFFSAVRRRAGTGAVTADCGCARPDRRLARPVPLGRPQSDPEAAAAVTADVRRGFFGLLDEVRGSTVFLPPARPELDCFAGATSSNLGQATRAQRQELAGLPVPARRVGREGIGALAACAEKGLEVAAAARNRVATPDFEHEHEHEHRFAEHDGFFGARC